MNEPIKTGDLVVVVRPTPCCGHEIAMGSVYKAVFVGRVQMECKCCGATLPAGTTIVAKSFRPNTAIPGSFLLFGHTAERLKRIPPLEELETEKNREELTA